MSEIKNLKLSEKAKTQPRTGGKFTKKTEELSTAEKTQWTKKSVFLTALACALLLASTLLSIHIGHLLARQ